MPTTSLVFLLIRGHFIYLFRMELRQRLKIWEESGRFHLSSLLAQSSVCHSTACSWAREFALVVIIAIW